MVRRAAPKGHGPLVIRIVRPEEPPEVLAKKGAPLVRNMLAEYHADPRSYQYGAKTFDFAQDVYGHADVKRRLSKAQHDKCAYCEVRIVSEAGDVEHFRPKAGVRQGRDHPKQSPGYFWLAYTWSNLLYACSRCNREHKRELFPLEDPTVRADALRDEGSTAGEAPLLLDPTLDAPEFHLRFNGERAEPVRGGRRGRVTIDVLGLNRTRLLEARREKLEDVRKRVNTLRLVREGLFPMDHPEARKHLQELCREILAAADSRAPFAAMIRGAVQQWLASGLEFPCSEERLVAWALSRASLPG
jgi:uncharacterized protein (TIGR02646 family)